MHSIESDQSLKEKRGKKKEKVRKKNKKKQLCIYPDSNPGPSGHEASTLSVELLQLTAN